MMSDSDRSASCGAGGDTYGGAILDAAEDQIFTDNSSILATFANMTALAVSAHSRSQTLRVHCGEQKGKWHHGVAQGLNRTVRR